MLKCLFEILKELEIELKKYNVKTIKLSFIIIDLDILQAKIDIYKNDEIISFYKQFHLAQIKLLSNMTEQASFYNWKHEIIKCFRSNNNEN